MKRVVTPVDIGHVVRRRRRASGLRQGDLAGIAGVGTRFLIELEAGKPSLRLDKVLAVMVTLGIDVYLDGDDE